MADTTILLRREDESELAFIWRLGEYKSTGSIDLTWEQIATVINAQCRSDEEPFRNESAYRKQYQTAKVFYDEVFAGEDAGKTDKRLQMQMDELYKAKKQFYDQRREYNKELTVAARSDHLMNELLEAAKKLPKLTHYKSQFELEYDSFYPGEDENEAVLFLSDWHYGCVADNIWNKTDEDIFRDRINTLVKKAIQNIARFKPSKLHVVILGDMVEGVIHTSSRVASSELGSDQIMKVSEVLANVVADLANHVPEVMVYSTYGNHGRSVQNFKDSIHADNMEKIIPWWMKERLKEFNNVKFVDSLYEFIYVEACGNPLVAVHGDLDNKKNVAKVSSAVFYRALGLIPETVVMGHVHHNSELDDLGIEVITVGSLCGTDLYANDHRLYSSASQTMLIYTREGIENKCNIKFSSGKDFLKY